MVQTSIPLSRVHLSVPSQQNDLNIYAEIRDEAAGSSKVIRSGLFKGINSEILHVLMILFVERGV